ncbi:MAG: VanW family protein, partial [Actinomycetota bacterium]
RILRARLVEKGDDARLQLIADDDALAPLVADQLAAVEAAPADAELELIGDDVRVQPGRSGFGFDAAKAAAQLLHVATSRGDRSAVLRGELVRPDFGTADARALDITEQVSSFTTYHDCCEPRVQNIHTIAEIIDGAVVEPGETFSVNGYVGPRTASKGFVSAPAIFEGEYVEEVGGGVSQFATTMFNAIFFGGYDLLEYKPHSYYIDRYPRGREATVSYPSPDLEFLNDSDAGIYIDTSYTDTSITVSFYGNTDVEVDAVMGEPYNFERPPVQREINRSLPEGASQVVQSGTRGFDVEVERIFVYPGGDRDTEGFFTRYLPEPRIIERNPRKR